MTNLVEVRIKAIDESKKPLTDSEKAWQDWSKKVTDANKNYMSVQKQKEQALKQAAATEQKALKDATLAQEQQAATAKKAHAEQIQNFAKVTAAAVAFGVAIKKAYDFAKEGAQLEFTAIKFDRLAQTIGTTGDALLEKLRPATRGVMSDMELIASATDTMSLGLVKTEGDAVRLTTVMAGLGMDMNQVVLALSNQTTMRFDQLGVSVAGFDDRLKALKESGLDANSAFTEAFLQQAEEQLTKVGHAADTTAGEFMKLEASIKNTGDEVKKNFANAIAPMIKGINDNREAIDKFNDAAELGYEILRRYGYETEGAREQVYNIGYEYQRAEQYGAAWAKVLGEDITPAQQEAAMSAEDMAKAEEEAIKIITKANQEYLDTLGDVTKKMGDYSQNIQDAKEDQAELLAEKKKLIDQGWWVESEKVQAVTKKIDENQKKIDEYTQKYEEDTQRRILAGLEEQLSIDGLTEAEMRYIEDVGLARGTYTQEAVDEMRAVRGEIDSLTKAFYEIPDEKTITIKLNTLGDTTLLNAKGGGSTSGINIPIANQMASGTRGWETVPAGYPNDTYPVGLTSGEKFAVIPANKSGGGNYQNGTGTAVMLDEMSIDKLASRLETALQRLVN